jgi:hypothetical protein
MLVPYVTDPSYYKVLEIYARPNKTIVDINYDVDTRDDMLVIGVGLAYQSTIEKTAEYEESKTFQTDNLSIGVGLAYQSTIEKTAEYAESRTFQTDNLSIGVGLAYQSTMVFVST